MSFFGWTTATCKELTASEAWCEAWYDAEEDLKPAEPEASPEMGQNPSVHVLTNYMLDI